MRFCRAKPLSHGLRKDGRVVQRRSLPVSPPLQGGFFYAHFAPKSAKLWNTPEILENLWAEHRKNFTVLSLMAHAEPWGSVVSLIQ